MNTTTTVTKPSAARARIEAENQRLAERNYGKYAQRYTASLESIPARGSCVEYFQGAGSNDLIRSAEYVEAVRSGGQYASVSLYDRIEGRHVTAADVRRVREACGGK